MAQDHAGYGPKSDLAAKGYRPTPAGRALNAAG